MRNWGVLTPAYDDWMRKLNFSSVPPSTLACFVSSLLPVQLCGPPPEVCPPLRKCALPAESASRLKLRVHPPLRLLPAPWLILGQVARGGAQVHVCIQQPRGDATLLWTCPMMSGYTLLNRHSHNPMVLGDWVNATSISQESHLCGLKVH